MIDKLDICYRMINNYDKCKSYIANFDLSLFFQKLVSIDLLIIFVLFFFVTFIFTKNIKTNFIKFRNYTLCFNFFILIAILYTFPVNLPFGDVWEEYQAIRNNSLKNYLFSVNLSGHSFFTTRLIFYLVDKFLDLNLVYIHIFSLFLYCLSLFIYFKFLNEIKIKYFFVLLPLLFSGKWFNHIFETINLVWVFNFLLTLLIIYYLNLRNNFKLIPISIILFVLLLSFAGGYIIIIYLITCLIFNEEIKFKNKLNFFFVFAGILFFTTELIPTFKDGNPYIISDYIGFLSLNKITKIIETFFGMISSIYLPFILYKLDLFKNLTILLGFIQTIVLFIIFFDSKINFKKFILENPFLIIGIIGCLIISITRTNNFGEMRYATYSIIFQIGFFIFILKSKKIIIFFDKFYKSIFLLFIIIYSLNLFSPHTGIFFPLNRYIVKNNIDKCLVNNNFNKCENLMYKELFFYSNWFDRDDFSILINKMKKEKKSFFYDSN